MPVSGSNAGSRKGLWHKAAAGGAPDGGGSDEHVIHGIAIIPLCLQNDEDGGEE